MKRRTQKLKRLPPAIPVLDIERLLSEHEEIDFLLGELNCDERAMVEMVYREGLSVESAAKHLGLSNDRAQRELEDAEEALSRLTRLLYTGASEFEWGEP
ncbi:MAG: hypothetical protein JXA36_07535 [Coriobacteriia bacterium]|nr:hypothetical protein [Coriobacteriia bacterium]